MQGKVLLLSLLLQLCGGSVADLVHVDLSSQKAWRLTNANNSISLPTTVPAHTLSVLASAGLVAQDPLSRYGERDTRWVGEERWNFTLIWSGKKHQLLTGCRHVLLVLHGIDTFGTVVLNGRHLLHADNAHRSWWVPLTGPDALREGANMLSIVLQPAVTAAMHAKAAYPYPVPTMQVPGAINVYNFVRKPAFDFGWDWGPAFVPVGVSGGVELVGFDRATLVGALVTQQFNSSSDTFDLTITAQFLVPAEGDVGTLSVTLAVLDLHEEQQVTLQPGIVGGNQLQALVIMTVQLPASKVELWQPLTLLPKGKTRKLYDLAVMFEPSPDLQQPGRVTGACGVVGSSSAGHSHAPEPDIRSTIVRRIGFRTVELVQQPIQEAMGDLLGQQSPGQLKGVDDSQHHPQGLQEQLEMHQQPSRLPEASGRLQDQQQGESFYFKINGVPIFAKGANLIPLHVLSTAVTAADVEALLQSAVEANMNMIRIWGGGRYQVDALYEAADELGFMVWQEAMFACSPYPRNAGFLANIEAEVTQQLLRLGSHASLVVFGGNNEVEQSLEWYRETRSNMPMYSEDYSTLFVRTIGRLVQQMLPATPWVDSSPSKGDIFIPDTPGMQAPGNVHSPAADDALHGTQEAAEDPSDGATATSSTQELSNSDTTTGPPAAAIDGTRVKRWGNTNDPSYGDVHFYNYQDDCQDWRTYPLARFISEYGWQSYPSWATYAAATSEKDWELVAGMTEYRQRHPNGTVELLAQLQRRFRLPEQWLALLPQHKQDHNEQHSESEKQQHHQVASGSRTSEAWQHWLAYASGMLTSLAGRLGLLHVPPSSEERHATAAHVPTASGLAVGTWRSSEDTSTGSASNSISNFTDMQHFIYLTQLQQMLCYETALHHWRRLRSDPSTLSMGVLYWQLNDVWAGASWSSIDYGGVWKPVHYGVARAFADVTLSVKHDLQEDTISVYVVNDLQQPAQLQLAVRVLSVSDTAAQCQGSSRVTDTASYQGISRFALAAPSYVKHHNTLQTEAPPGAAVLVWSEAVGALLRKAGHDCSRSSCYVHVTLASGGEQQQEQEATVWLAPFSDLPLRQPGLAVDGFGPVKQPPGAAEVAGGRHNKGDAIQFTVSSQAVAPYAVWETQGGALPGHFSDNALTIHPCEPREVSFKPLSTRRHGSQSGIAAGSAKGSSIGSNQEHAGHKAVQQQWHDVLRLLQEQLVVSSLWDHQQFGQQQDNSIAVV